MNHLRPLRTVAASSMLLVACSSGGQNLPFQATTTADAGAASFDLSMQSSVAAGGETHRCLYIVAPTTTETFIVKGSHSYTPGSHHMILYRTDLSEIPAGMDGDADCYEGGGAGGFMSHVRGIVYAAQTPTGELDYPQGVGLPVAAGEVFMMQTHYLNASSDVLDARADLSLTLSDGSDITTHAGILFFYDPFIDVPPKATAARAATRCLIRGDITLITASSHYHKRGYDYAAFIDPAADQLATDPFYTSSDWEKPTALATPFAISAGSRVRYQCVYANASTNEYFQGQSAEDDEMCMFIATYYPALETADEECTRDRDMIGTGSVGCGGTLACLRACPSGFDPGSLGAGNTSVDPCIQTCLVDSCPDATAKLFAVNACTRDKCSAECANAGSSDCTTCAQAQCGSQAVACISDACN